MIDPPGKISSPAASNNPSRQSNIELLRILSMFLICLHHLCLCSNFQWTSMTPGLYTVQCLSLGGKVGVSIFILITGYFLVNQRITGKKVMRFYLQVFFYSLCIYLVTKIILHQGIDGNELRVILMPISNNSYWFATTYLMIYLSAPFINIFLRALTKEQHFFFVFICVSIWILWNFYNIDNINYSEYVWMFLLYMIGAYIRLYPPQRFTRQIANLIYLFLLVIGACLTLYVYNNVSKHYYTNATYFLSLDNFFIFSISLILFLIFLNIRIPYSKTINALGSATFGVYLLHENSYIRPVLWTKIFRSGDMQESPLLIPYAIGVCLLIMAVFSIVDLIRKILLEKPVMKIIDKYGPSISVPLLHIWKEIWHKIYIEKSDASK